MDTNGNWICCSDSSPAFEITGTTYDLTMAVDPLGGGSTDPSVGLHSYPESTVVDIEAIAETGYVFDHWSGAVSGSANPTTVTMDADQAVTAHFVAEPTSGVVTQDGAFSTANDDGVSSVSFAHTLGTGADRLLMVGVSWNSLSTATTISSVTFTPDGGGDPESLTPVITQQPTGQMRYSAIYSLLPDSVALGSGATGMVTVTFSASISNGLVAGAVNFQGVDQTTPLGTAVGAASTNNTTQLPLVTLTGLSGNELVFDNVFMGGTDSSQTIAPVSDQTELWNAFNPNTRGSASFEQAAASSVTMDWDAASNGWWAITAVPIVPALH